MIGDDDEGRGGVGRAEVEAIGLESEAEAFAGGVPWREAAATTEDGTRRRFCEEEDGAPASRERGALTKG